jgi:mono/diheme cytochrome c family protein
MRAVSITAFIAMIAIASVSDARGQGPELGESEFMNSCASCHGPAGKGDGPVISSLIKPPPDLTKLSERNGGVFPFSRVHEVIDGTIPVMTHGTRDMPVWGQVYRRNARSSQQGTGPSFLPNEIAEALVRVKMLALIEYISTLQGK